MHAADKYMTFREAYERTLERIAYIEKQGFKMHEKWECEIRRELIENAEMRGFFKNFDIFEPMNPREGL